MPIYGIMECMNTENEAKNTEKSTVSNISGLVDHLQRVDAKGAQAEANKTSMVDGEGRRFKFNEDGGTPKNSGENSEKPPYRVFRGAE